MDSAEFHAAVTIFFSTSLLPFVSFRLTGLRYSQVDTRAQSNNLWHEKPGLQHLSAVLNLDGPGHIAKLIGMPNYARAVGQGRYTFPTPNVSPIGLLLTPLALKFVSSDADPPVPWHRVINSAGTISSRGPGTDGAQRQRDALEAEDVEVTTGRTGEMRIDLRRWGWFPQPNQIENYVDADDVNDTV